METLQQLTCLQFLPRKDESDYLTFRSREEDHCASYVGRTGGVQVVELGSGCNYQSTILHEICHALGMWHEQSRPDRDEYVQVMQDNVKNHQLHNFLKRNIFEVDSQGAPYDYASVMHYSLDSFAKEDRLDTLKVIDEEEYEKQGRPYVGYAPTLSKLDVTQLNRLYNCPGSGIRGTLRVYVAKAENINPPSSDAFVMVTAYDDKGGSETKTTHYISDSADPTWNVWLDFGKPGSWQYVDVSIWDYDQFSSNDQLTNPQSFSVNPGHHNRQYCPDRTCYMRMIFSISLTDDCHCFNGGRCLSDGTCNCTTGYGGPRCEYVRGRLRILARNANNLLDEDSSSTSESDAYLEFVAYDHHGGISYEYTNVVIDSLNPVWNEQFDFGENDWSWFTVQAWDEDNNGDERLSYAHTYTLQSYTSVERQQMKGLEGGTIIFDYSFQP